MKQFPIKKPLLLSMALALAGCGGGGSDGQNSGGQNGSDITGGQTGDSQNTGNQNGNDQKDGEDLGAVENVPPKAIAGSDFSVESGQAGGLNGASSYDPDGSVVSYFWEVITPVLPSLIIESPNTAVSAFVAPEVTEQTEFTLRLTVTDNVGEQRSDTVVVRVDKKESTLDGIMVGDWQSRSLIETAPGKASDPNVKVWHNEVALVSWVQYNGVTNDLFALKLDLNSGEKMEFDVISNGSESVFTSRWNHNYPTFSHHDVELLNDGNAAIIYHSGYGFGQVSPISVVIYSKDTNSWSAPAVISSSSDTKGAPRLATNGSDLIAVWYESAADAETHLWSARFNKATASWLPAEIVDTRDRNSGYSTRSNLNGHLAATMDEAGTATVIWTGKSESGDIDLLSSTFDETAGWGTPVIIDNLATKPETARSVVDKNGNTHVVWAQNDLIGSSVFYSTLDASSGLWSQPLIIEALSGESYMPDIDANEQGRLSVAFGRKDYESSYHTDIFHNEFIPGEGWVGESEVSDLGKVLPLIHNDQFGNAMILYSSHNVHARRKAVDGGWKSLGWLSGPYGSSQHTFDITPSGKGAAAWVTSEDGTDNIYLSIFK